MKNKIIFLFLFAGVIIYTLTIGTNIVSSIFLILIYIYLISIIKQNDKKSSIELKNHEELVNIINNVPIAAFLKDLNNNIIAANKDFFKLLNIKENSDYKQISKKIYSGLDKNEITFEDYNIVKNAKTINCERSIKTENITKHYKIYKTPIISDNGEIKIIAVFIKNVENNPDSSSESNKNIIATLTHDLKTPAVAQIRAIELLLKGNFGEINETQRSFLNDILNSCNNMLDMLVNMLWLYKFDNKRVAVNISSFDVNELIKDVFSENKLLLNSNNRTFKQNNKTAKIHILADKMHIKRIICNLLVNAISHSKDNSTIYIETYVQNNTFTFKVTNEGEYLPDELLKCIFDKNKVFSQKSEGLSTGLGLYLSNSLLELNGGKFLYSSNPNGQNTFGFTLQLYPEKHQVKNPTISIKQP